MKNFFKMEIVTSEYTTTTYEELVDISLILEDKFICGKDEKNNIVIIAPIDRVVVIEGYTLIGTEDAE